MRNPNDEEVDRLNELDAARHGAAEDFKDFDLQLRLKYLLPDEVQIGRNGEFLMGNARYRKPAAHGAPHRLQDKLTPAERDEMVGLLLAGKAAARVYERFTYQLKLDCGVPMGAKLTPLNKWVREGPQGLGGGELFVPEDEAPDALEDDEPAEAADAVDQPEAPDGGA